MGIYSTVDCCEVHGTRSETQNDDGLAANVTLRVASALRWDLMADLLGNRNVWPHTPGTWTDWPRALTCGAVPVPDKFTATGQSIDYDFYNVAVTYGAAEEDLIAESLEPTVEFQTLDYRRFRWDAGDGVPLKEGEAPGRQLRGLNLVRTIFKVETIPISILDLPGTCNDAEYVSAILGLTFPLETLLFHPPQMSRTITTAGVKAWDLNLKFQYKPETWNKFWNPYSELYEEIFLVGAVAPYKNYPLANFSDFLS
jgi:hypothetical protein